MKTKCKNCASLLHGKFCSFCGQREHQKLSFSEIRKDFFDDIFDYDARLFSALKHLILKPGFLTVEYWEGKRIKHLQPFKIYLITSVLFYLVSSYFKTEKKSIFDLSKLFLKQIHQDIIINIGSILNSYSQEIELILFTPITGLVLMVLYKRTNHAFLHHMIASIHLSSFIFLILSVIETLSNILAGFAQYFAFLNIIIPLYSVLMLSHIYKESITKSIIKVFVIFCTVLLRNLILYAIGFLYLILK